MRKIQEFLLNNPLSHVDNITGVSNLNYGFPSQIDSETNNI